MINSFLKINVRNARYSGAVTLVFTLILLMVSTLIILFAGNYSMLNSKISANFLRFDQAFQAAEAGLEYGIVYLETNSATILANPVNGFINSITNSSITNVTLTNGSQYTITYTNPTANNYKLIQITSTGKSADGTATHVMTQQVYFGSLVLNPPSLPVVSRGTVSMSGNSTVTNLERNNTITAGSTVTMSGGSQTVTSGGVSSTPGHIQGDVTQNNSTIGSQSSSDFFASYFGMSSDSIKNNMSHYYTSNSSTNYSSTLNGMTGTSIWIDQTGGSATLNGNTTIGSLTNPVLLIVNGDLDISGNVKIFGFVYVSGRSSQTTDITGNLTITGGLINGGDLSMSGNININYNNSVISSLQNKLSYYAKVPGSWKDF